MTNDTHLTQIEARCAEEYNEWSSRQLAEDCQWLLGQLHEAKKLQCQAEEGTITERRRFADAMTRQRHDFENQRAVENSSRLEVEASRARLDTVNRQLSQRIDTLLHERASLLATIAELRGKLADLENAATKEGTP